jgi:hypothetical protein
MGMMAVERSLALTSTPAVARDVAMPREEPLNRRRALARLDATIDEAERACAKRRAVLERLVADRRDPQAAMILLRIAEQRLAQLRASRDVLIGGEPPDDAAGSL